MRIRTALVLAGLVAVPVLATATPASAVCYYDLEGVQRCDNSCWPLEDYVRDPVGMHCAH